MKAIRIDRPGGAETLKLVELAVPTPRRGEALVRVEAAGVNYHDIYVRSGAYPHEFPAVLGQEGAGTVEAVGEEAGEVRVGQRVSWAGVPGSYATHVLAPAEKLVPVPEGVSARMAAASLLQGMTAHYLTNATFPLKAGDTCLVHAAAGGAGLLVVQLAKRANARVFGTTSSEAKNKIALEAGADECFLYSGREPFDEAVRARTEGRGADVVYDSVGASTFDRSLLALRRRGVLVLFGQSSGRVPPFDLQLLNARGSLFVTRPKLGDYVATRGELLERASAVLNAIARGELAIRIHAEFPLSRAEDAHRALESRATSGKLLLVP
jgi:NADPH2:quinone reductase